jgi:DHA1 family bicyclomycin/chloramphenicol resistance-like MFS transporter
METSSIRREHLRLVVILGTLTAFAPLSIDMYLPAFPAIAAHFHASEGAVQATLAVFFVGMAMGQSVLGPLSDRTGRLPPLLIGTSVFVAASIWAALAPDIESLTAARFLQALGGSTGIVTTRSMVRDLFEERESAQVYSLLMLVMGVAPILAPMAGSFLIVRFDWSVLFWILAGFGLLCIALVTLFLGETLPPERRHKGGIGHVLRAYVALAGDRSFVAFTLANACISASMFAYITGSPFVFIEIHGFTPTGFAAVFGSIAGTFILMSQVNARLLRRIGGRTILKIAMTVHLAAALLLFALTLLAPAATAPLFLLYLLVPCLGFIGSNAIAAAMSRAGANVGAAAALTGVVQFAMAAVSGATVGALNNGTAVPMVSVIAGLSALGTIARLFAR